MEISFFDSEVFKDKDAIQDELYDKIGLSFEKPTSGILRNDGRSIMSEYHLFYEYYRKLIHEKTSGHLKVVLANNCVKFEGYDGFIPHIFLWRNLSRVSWYFPEIPDYDERRCTYSRNYFEDEFRGTVTNEIFKMFEKVAKSQLGLTPIKKIFVTDMKLTGMTTEKGEFIKAA